MPTTEMTLLPACKTKIVCTIGPATSTPAVMRQMLEAGMNIARLNYAHGDLEGHAQTIADLRAAALETGHQLTILADLPGLNLRIGALNQPSVGLQVGAAFTLTTAELIGDQSRVSVNWPELPGVLKAGDTVFLSDGGIELQVVRVLGPDVECQVRSGGDLEAHKGLNLPGIDLGRAAFTDRDRACLQSALSHGVDAISQSFVQTRADLDAVREAAREMGFAPFLIAKVERASALLHLDEIVAAADGIMIARGDLGVETPIHNIAIVQKQLTLQANLAGKPVITATQMLESMVQHPRPTRAEATDVANAILDGTDCVMLSEESAVGRYPVQAVQMLVAIAAATEAYRPQSRLRSVFTDYDRVHEVALVNLMSHNVQQTVDHLTPTAAFVATTTGRTARLVARFKLPVWLVAVGEDPRVCQGLQFSYGVLPLLVAHPPADWNAFATSWSQAQQVPLGTVVLAQGPSARHPAANHRLSIMDLRQSAPAVVS